MKKAANKKSAPKQTSKKAPAKKAPAAKKAAPKSPPPAKAKDNGALRKPQLRILAALAKAKAPLSRREVADKSPCDYAACTELIGSQNAETRKDNDEKHFPSLLTLGYVTAAEGDGGVTYTITPAGRAALKAAPAAAKPDKADPKATPSLGKTQLAVLKALAASKAPLTRAELSEKLGGAFIGSAVGYAGKDSTPSSLVGRGYVAITTGDGAATFAITPAGRAVVKGGK